MGNIYAVEPPIQALGWMVFNFVWGLISLRIPICTIGSPGRWIGACYFNENDVPLRNIAGLASGSRQSLTLWAAILYKVRVGG